MNDITAVLHVLKLAYVAGVVLVLAVFFIKPYWMMPAEEWARVLFELQNEEDCQGKMLVVVLVLAYCVLALAWPFTGYLLIGDRVRNRD